jgi:hypothetical protein
MELRGLAMNGTDVQPRREPELIAEDFFTA